MTANELTRIEGLIARAVNRGDLELARRLSQRWFLIWRRQRKEENRG
ncbi:MAG: hypothetical protein LBE08_11780 [Bifidobacteriaceae bacterium]|jgi:hypothetical protein|nr:hypothetical protein [Bifidobacteriaceae bacterium]